MKILQGLKKAFTVILTVAFFIFALIFTIVLLYRNKYGITQFEDTSLIIIGNEITSENYEKSDLVIVKYQKVSDIAVGEELFAYKLGRGGAVDIKLGIVGEVSVKNDEVSFENGDTYSAEFLIGKTDKVYEEWGRYLSIITSKWGFLFMILVPSFLVFIFQVYALIIEIKYGEDDLIGEY